MHNICIDMNNHLDEDDLEVPIEIQDENVNRNTHGESYAVRNAVINDIF